MKKCDACKKEIPNKSKVCLHCNKKQRFFYNKNIIALVLLLVFIIIALFLASGNKKEGPLVYKKYEYGDVLMQEHTIPGSEYNIPKGFEITFEKQDFISKEDMEKVKDTNLGSGDVAALTINIKNITKKEITFSSWGFFNITINKYQIQKDFGTMKKLPSHIDFLGTLKEEVISPGESIKRIFAQEIPENDALNLVENDLVKTIIYDHLGIRFTVELP